jgi:DNA excision repair protein ERCC-3
VVLPCGSGKTIVGMVAIAAQRCETLIITSNSASLAQWRAELEARTTLAPEAVGEYSSQAKEIRPITLTTYQMLTHRPRRDAGFPHLNLFEQREWGLVIYDEVHLLPAPVFRATARIQARRPARAHRHARPRGRRRAAGVLPGRAQALRHGVARARGGGLDREC